MLQNGSISELESKAEKAAEKERRKEVEVYYLRFEAQQRATPSHDWDSGTPVEVFPSDEDVAIEVMYKKEFGERMEENRTAYLREKKSEHTMGTLVVVLPSSFKV